MARSLPTHKSFEFVSITFMKKILITAVKNILIAVLISIAVVGIGVLIGFIDASEARHYFLVLSITVLILRYWNLWEESRKKKTRE